MHGPLDPLLHDGVIDEICGRLKSGKEADLWLVRHGGEIVAAKVYKARHARSFKHNAGYKEGRQVRDTRTQRAMDRGSRFGQAAAEEAWKAKEADALHTLHAAGVRVPKPVLFYEGVLLMELVLDSHGHPAPRLVDAHVPREAAAAMYADLRGQAIRMLRCDLIHGDLSPYNVLVGPHGPVVIDFPQVVGAAHNSQAESFFVRDVENLRRFFAGIDPSLRAAANDAREIWRAYVRRELTADFVPSGRAEHAAPQGPRAHGERQRGPREGRGAGREPGRAEGGPHGDRGQRHEAAGARGRHHGGGGAPSRHEGGGGAPGRQDGGGGRGRHDAGSGGRGRHDAGSADRRPSGGHPAPDRRRAPPSPEVIRVVRPPLTKEPGAAPAHRPHPAAPSAGTGQRAEGEGSGHRRRRRRGRR